MYNGDIYLEDVEKEQTEIRKDLGLIKQGDPKDKLPEHKKTKNNVKNIYNSREKVVQMFNDYVKNLSKNIYESKKETGLKILSHKQIYQRLPVALAQIKAENN